MVNASLKYLMASIPERTAHSFLRYFSNEEGVCSKDFMLRNLSTKRASKIERGLPTDTTRWDSAITSLSVLVFNLDFWVGTISGA